MFIAHLMFHISAILAVRATLQVASTIIFPWLAIENKIKIQKKGKKDIETATDCQREAQFNISSEWIVST